MIRDLRKNINEAQDYGQEALVNIKRAHRKNLEPHVMKHFEDESGRYARIAFSRAVRFAEFCDQVACNLAEDLK